MINDELTPIEIEQRYKKVVYTPRNQSDIKKLISFEDYNCQAYIDMNKKKKDEMNKLVSEINRRNEENYNLN